MFYQTMSGRRAGPLELEANSPYTAVFTGGLAGSAYPHKELGVLSGRRLNINVSAHSLKGHEYWRLFKKSDVKIWEQGQLERIEEACRRGAKPIVISFSTSTLVSLSLAAKHPDKIGALLLVGPPMRLKERWHHEVPMRIITSVDTLLSWFPIVSRPLRWLLRQFSVPMDNTDLQGATKQETGNPIYPEIPLAAIIALRRAQIRAKRALKKIKCPVLILQGMKDRWSKKEHALVLCEALGTPNKAIFFFNDSPHHIMLGPERADYLRVALSWMKTVIESGALEFDSNPGEIKLNSLLTVRLEGDHAQDLEQSE